MMLGSASQSHGESETCAWHTLCAFGCARHVSSRPTALATIAPWSPLDRQRPGRGHGAGGRLRKPGRGSAARIGYGCYTLRDPDG